MSNNCNASASIDTNEVFEENNHPPPSGKKYSISIDFGGVKGKDEAKWSSRCGALIRCHIPISYNEWRNVDDYYKNNLWQELLDEFDMDIDPALARPIVEKKFPQYFRTVKSTLRKSLLRSGGTTVPKNVAITKCPKDIDKVWWEGFIDNEYTDKKKEQCRKNAEAKAKNTITHTLGRKSYRRVYDEMVKENPNEQVTRTMVWKSAHKNKKTGHVLPSASTTYALVEEEEEKQKLECNDNDKAKTFDLDNDPLSKVFSSDKKKNYCRAISSTSSIKQVKMIEATKAIADKNKKDDFREWSSELQNKMANQMATQVSIQINDAFKSFTSTFFSMAPGLQQNPFEGNAVPRTETDSNLDKSHADVGVASSLIPSIDIGSSTREKQYVMLPSQDTKKEVAKGYIGTQTICHFREVVQNIEKVVWVMEVLDPQASIYDGPQNGHYKLCEFSDGGFVIWPVFRLRNI